MRIFTETFIGSNEYRESGTEYLGEIFNFSNGANEINEFFLFGVC